MKKYIITDKHPEIKEGVIISWEGDSYSLDCVSETKSVWLDIDEIKDQIEKGWIKEYKKPKKTKVKFYDHHVAGMSVTFKFDLDGDYDWIELRKPLIKYLTKMKNEL